MRTLSWNLLSSVTKHIDGAEAVITELSYLPGGIHACAISTIFDESEVSIVRSSAATCLANMICHQSRKSGLHKRVIPRCKVKIDTDRANAIEVLDEILERHSFCNKMHASLKLFTTAEIMENDVSVFILFFYIFF